MVRVLTAGLPPHALEVIRGLAPPGIELVELPADPAGRAALLPQSDLYFGSQRGPLPEIIAEMAGYRLVQLTSAGYERLDTGLLRRLRIPVATNGGANAAGVAEHAIMLMLACVKHLQRYHPLVRQGLWRGSTVVEPGELEGKTVGLAGFGAIGRQVARRLLGWNTRVVYHDVVRADPALEQELRATYLPWPQLLAEADILSLHLPLSAQTRRMVNQSMLAAMKPGAILINTARGGLVDEAALAQALTSGRLAAAGLDVFDPEPPEGDSPLLRLDNVVLTPHLAGNTAETWGKTAVIGYANLERVLRGEPPLHIIPELREGLPPTSPPGNYR